MTGCTQIARSLKNLLNNECSRTPEEDVRPSSSTVAEVLRVLSDDFGGGATRLGAAVSCVDSAPAAEATRAGARPAADLPVSSPTSPPAAEAAGGGPPFPAPTARTETERLILARVDQICDAAGRRSSTGLEKIVASLDRTMLKRLVNRRGSKGLTALSAAVVAGSFDSAELLLESGADPDLRPQNAEDTPILAQCIVTEGIDTVRMTTLLLAFNADPEVETRAGQTMMELARVRGNRPIRYWLTVAQALPPVPEASLALEEKVGLARLRSLEFCLVGQMPAKRQVVAAMSSYFRLYDARRRGGRPVVLLLPGVSPPRPAPPHEMGRRP